MMTLIFFKELLESKSICLVMGEADDKICSLSDAKFLYNQLILYYLKSNETEEKFRILQTFVKTPDKFKHMDLIKELEIDSLTKVEPIRTKTKK
jgi:hypothetical protein